MSESPPAGHRQFSRSLKTLNLAYLNESGQGAVTPPPPRRIAFVLLDNFSMMAFTGALDGLVTANLLGRAPLYEVKTFGIDHLQIACDLGISIAADDCISALRPDGADLLIVCGGLRSPLQPAASWWRNCASARGRRCNWAASGTAASSWPMPACWTAVPAPCTRRTAPA